MARASNMPTPWYTKPRQQRYPSTSFPAALSTRDWRIKQMITQRTWSRRNCSRGAASLAAMLLLCSSLSATAGKVPGGILSALRNRGEFVGELGETFLFTPPNGSIPAKRFMVIGLGEEKDLSLDSLRVVGRIAAREAVRLNARHVAWAPVIRDEGNTVVGVGEGDRAFIEQMLSAYDTEKRLQAEALAPAFSIEDLVIEAGPTYFDDAAKQVGEGIESMTAVLAQRNAAPYSSATKQ